MVDEMESELNARIFKVIAKLSEKKPEEISLKDRLVEDLDFDSLKGLEAIARLSSYFKIKVDLNLIEEIKTVEDIFRILESKLQKTS